MLFLPRPYVKNTSRLFPSSGQNWARPELGQGVGAHICTEGVHHDGKVCALGSAGDNGMELVLKFQ